MRALTIIEMSPGNFYLSKGKPPAKSFTIEPENDSVATELGERYAFPTQGKSVLTQVLDFFEKPEVQKETP